MKTKLNLGSFYLTPQVRTMAVTIAFPLACLLWLYTTNTYLSVAFGCVIILVVGIVMPPLQYLANLHYVRYINAIKDPLKMVAKVRLGSNDGNDVPGIFVLMETGLLIYSRNDGGHELLLNKGQVNEIRLMGIRGINISLSDTQLIKVMSKQALYIYRVLTEEGWNCIPLDEEEK